MLYIITHTTDCKYVGKTVEYTEDMTELEISKDLIMFIEHIVRLNETELRLINSNYIIELKEV